MPTIRVLNTRVKIPANRAARTALGGTLVVGGVFGFLPVLGFWMIPAGALVLAVDSPRIRRINRRTTVKVVRRWRGRARAGEAAAPEGAS